MNHFYDDAAAVAAVAVISFANDDIPSKRRPPMSGGHVSSLFPSRSRSSVPARFPREESEEENRDGSESRASSSEVWNSEEKEKERTFRAQISQTRV